MMTVDYMPMWLTMTLRGLTPAKLRKAAGLSPATFTKLRKNEPVNVATLLEIAEVLDAGVDKIVRFRREE